MIVQSKIKVFNVVFTLIIGFAFGRLVGASNEGELILESEKCKSTLKYQDKILTKLIVREEVNGG